MLSQRAGGRNYFCAVSPKVHEAFECMRLAFIFEYLSIYKSGFKINQIFIFIKFINQSLIAIITLNYSLI